jgi:hypothetical protein
VSDDRPTRRATIRTTHGDAGTATRVAGAVRPDNTDAMDTRVDGERVVTTIGRETTGGLESTVDDYVVNVTVAARLAGDDTPHSQPDDTNGDAADTDTADADAAASDTADADSDTADSDTDTTHS